MPGVTTLPKTLPPIDRGGQGKPTDWNYLPSSAMTADGCLTFLDERVTGKREIKGR